MPTFKVPVRIVHPGSGGDAFNIWHLRTVSDDSDDFNNGMDALDAFYTKIKGIYPNGTQVIVGEGVIRDPYGSPTYTNYVPTEITGTGQTAQAPQLLAVVVSWYTQSATRSGRGRTFLGPLELQALEADGTVASAWLSEIRQAADDLVNDSQTYNAWAFGVYSHKDGVLRDFVSYNVRDRFSYLRSRRD